MKKSRIAILFAYIGEPFHGLQYQKWKIAQGENAKETGNLSENFEEIETVKESESLKDTKSIEETEITDKNSDKSQEQTDQESANVLPTIERTVLEQAVKHELLKPTNLEPDKCHVRRACRTDKGVSAAINVISLCVEKNGNREEFLDCFKSIDVNSSTRTDLCNFIRIYKIIDVSKTFTPKLYVSYRTYSYLLPKKAVPTANIEILQNLFDFYSGTKNYHNFTKRNTEKGTKRYIMKTKVIDLGDFYEVQITGQSFMMHQIRKMIGLVVLIVWYVCPKDETQLEIANPDDSVVEERVKKIFSFVFSDEKVNIPKSPSTYLYLHTASFDIYDKKCEKNEKYNEKIEINENELDVMRAEIRKSLMKTDNLFEEWKNVIIEHMDEYSYLF